MSLLPLPASTNSDAIGKQRELPGGAGLQIAQEHVLRIVGVVGNEVRRERGEDHVAPAGRELHLGDAVVDSRLGAIRRLVDRDGDAGLQVPDIAVPEVGVNPGTRLVPSLMNATNVAIGGKARVIAAVVRRGAVDGAAREHRGGDGRTAPARSRWPCCSPLRLLDCRPGSGTARHCRRASARR